jgi:hypothetical protein
MGWENPPAPDADHKVRTRIDSADEAPSIRQRTREVLNDADPNWWQWLHLS